MLESEQGIGGAGDKDIVIAGYDIDAQRSIFLAGRDFGVDLKETK